MVKFEGKVSSQSIKKKNEANNQKPKQDGWFKLLSKMVGWMILVFISFMLFFQFLPVILLSLGHILVLFGTVDAGPTIVDAMIYVLTGFSLTVVLTMGFIYLLKKEIRHISIIRMDLSQRLVKKYRKK